MFRKRVAASARRGLCCLRLHRWESWGLTPFHETPFKPFIMVPTRWCRSCLLVEQQHPKTVGDGFFWYALPRLNPAVRVTSLDV